MNSTVNQEDICQRTYLPWRYSQWKVFTMEDIQLYRCTQTKLNVMKPKGWFRRL